MKKKRICICAAQVPFIKGGAEILTEELYKQLINRQYNVEIVQMPFKWYPKDQLLKSILSWRMIDLSESNGEKIDLIIPTKFPSYAVQHENKIIWLVHQFRQIYDQYETEYSNFGDNELDNKVREQIIKIDNIVLGEANKIYTIAENTRNRLEKHNNIKSETLYHPPKHVGRYYCEDFDDYILSVGRIESVKRVDLLIEALQYCNSKIKALIAGTGPFLDELKLKTEKLNLSDRVFFLGFVSDKELLRLYANCFAVFFAPFDEDYGYITLEAFLSQKPVITCEDSGGVLEFVENKKSGFVSETNPYKIGKNIQDLWDNKRLAKEMGKIGYQKVKYINWDIVIDKLTETIR